MRNYHYLTGTGPTMRVWFVDGKRQASVIATGSAFRPDVAAWYGGKGRSLLPVVCR